MKYTERNKCRCPKITIACNEKKSMHLPHFFVQLCRQSNKSENSKVFNAFKSSIKMFDNIVGNTVFRITTVLLKFQNCAFKPGMCKMGGNFRLQNGLNLLCRLYPSGQRPTRRMIWSQLVALCDCQNL